MNRTKVESSETEDQIIETSEGLRDYLQACARQALRSVIDEEVAALCAALAIIPMMMRSVVELAALPPM